MKIILLSIIRLELFTHNYFKRNIQAGTTVVFQCNN